MILETITDRSYEEVKEWYDEWKLKYPTQQESQEEMEHPVTNGANRTEHIQEMIMEGYTDQQILSLHDEITQADIDSAKRDLLDQ